MFTSNDRQHYRNNPLKEPPPSLLRRFAAISYDSFLLLAIAFCCTAAMIYLKEQLITSTAIGSPALEGTSAYILRFIICLSIYGFFIYFWQKHGQTLGMQTWKIKLHTNDNETSTVSFKQANIRFFTAILSISCFGMGYWWVLIDKEKRSWHDIASSSLLSKY